MIHSDSAVCLKTAYSNNHMFSRHTVKLPALRMDHLLHKTYWYTDVFITCHIPAGMTSQRLAQFVLSATHFNFLILCLGTWRWFKTFLQVCMQFGIKYALSVCFWFCFYIYCCERELFAVVTVAVLNSSYMDCTPSLKEISVSPLFEMSGYSPTWSCYARWWPQGFACHWNCTRYAIPQH